MTTLRGTCSWFGGPEDTTGVAADEGLAFIYSVDMAPHLFLPEQPPGTTGLARRLDPEVFYIACRWNYDETPKEDLLDIRVTVEAVKTGIVIDGVYPADWGPHEEKTGRAADLSKGLMDALGIETDDEVIVTFYPLEKEAPMFTRIIISSGHGKYVRGASGIIDEVDEARLVVERLADELEARGVEVLTYHDDVSKSQGENLARIVDFHNSEVRDLDISVHFNAYEQVSKCMGTEVLYLTQYDLAASISEAIASCGFIDRGAKKRTDLYFLNETAAPALLLEICFVDSECDCSVYAQQFDSICAAIANVLAGEEYQEVVEEPEQPIAEVPSEPSVPARPWPRPPRIPRVDIEVSGDVVIFVNGEKVM